MDKTDRLRDYGLAFLLYEHGLGVCGYELIRELFIFIKLILNSYLVIYFVINSCANTPSAQYICKNTKNIQKSDFMDGFWLQGELDLTLFYKTEGYFEKPKSLMTLMTVTLMTGKRP